MDSLQTILDSITSNRYLAAGIIIAAAFVASRLVDFIIARVCMAVARRTQGAFDDQFVKIMHNPVRTTVFVFGLRWATNYLDLREGPTRAVHIALDLLLLIVWTVFAFRFVTLVIKALSANDRMTVVVPRTEPIFGNVARVLLLAAAIYFFFLVIGVQPTAWLASAGVVGLAVGFAAKDTLANLFAGVFILADAPYQVGDMVNLDDGDRGMVTHIGLRSTRLLRRDDVEITLPNAVIANAKIVNESGGPYKPHRIAISIGVAYGSDIDKVQEILEDIAISNENTLAEPAPRVRFRQFGASSLDFDLLAWIQDPGARGITKHELNRAIYKRFAVEGVTIPFPQHDLWIREMPKGSD